MSWGSPWGTEWGVGVPEIDFRERLGDRIWTVLLRSSVFYGQLIPWIADQMQLADDIAYDVGQFTQLANAYGESLRKWGQALGLPRLGLTEGQWRQALALKAASVFRGRSVDLVLEVTDVLTTGTDTTYVYLEHFPASYEIVFSDISTTTATHFERILRFCKPEGIRFYSKIVEDSSTSFRFDTAGRGFDQGNEFAYTLET